MARVELGGPFELGHVTAVELAVAGRGQPLACTWRAKPIGTSPSRRPQMNSDSGDSASSPAQNSSGSSSADVAGRGVEGDAAARGQVGAQELVERGRDEVRVGAGHHAPDDPLDEVLRRRLEEAELGPHEPQAAPTGGRAATPSTGVISTSRSTRSGCRIPTSSATRPPMLWPSTCARSSSSASSSASTQRANKRGVVAAPGTACRSRRSRAGRSRSSGSSGASAGTVGRNSALVAPSPCSITIGCRRCPASNVDTRPQSVSSVPELEPVGVVARVGRGQEADAEVQVAAHVQPAGAVGLHAALEVAGDAAPTLPRSAVSSASGSAAVAGLACTRWRSRVHLEVPGAVARSRRAARVRARAACRRRRGRSARAARLRLRAARSSLATQDGAGAPGRRSPPRTRASRCPRPRP